MRSFVMVALLSSVASAAPPELRDPADDDEPAMTEDERAAEEDAEIAISQIEDEVFGRPAKKYRRKHHKPARPDRKYAVASSALIGRGLGASLYRAMGKHVAVRLNIAAYPHQTNPAAALGVALIAHEAYDDENYRDGGFVDVGASTLVFPRRLLDGPTLEIGALRRAQDTYLYDWRSSVHTRNSTTYAARALVGWSWAIRERWFVSMALGASYGYARGAGATADRNLESDAPLVPYRVAQWETKFECYTRVGFQFGDAL